MSGCKIKGTPLLDCLPKGCDIGPIDCLIIPATLSSCELSLCDAEQSIFDCWAAEHVNAAGVEIEFFHFNLDTSTRDPLYDEAIERVFDGSYKFKAFVEYPEADTEATEQGFHVKWDATLWIPRANIESVGAPIPTEDDVVRLWNTPFYKKYSVAEQDIPGSGYFFNITKVDEDGHLFDQAGFVGFKCVLKRNTEYTPERRMDND